MPNKETRKFKKVIKRRKVATGHKKSMADIRRRTLKPTEQRVAEKLARKKEKSNE